MLPTVVRVWNLWLTPPPSEEFVNNQTSFFVWIRMRKCDSKLYSYRLCLGDAMDPILRHGRWQLDNNWVSEINPILLAEILQEYQGTNDFVCFAEALEATARKTWIIMSTIRTVRKFINWVIKWHWRCLHKDKSDYVPKTKLMEERHGVSVETRSRPSTWQSTWKNPQLPW